MMRNKITEVGLQNLGKLGLPGGQPAFIVPAMF